MALWYKLPTREDRKKLPLEPGASVQAAKDFIRNEGQITVPFKLRVFIKGNKARYLKPEQTLGEVAAMGGGAISVAYTETASRQRERRGRARATAVLLRKDVHDGGKRARAGTSAERDRVLSAFLAHFSACKPRAAAEQLRRILEAALQKLSPTELRALLAAATAKAQTVTTSVGAPPSIELDSARRCASPAPAKRCRTGYDGHASAPPDTSTLRLPRSGGGSSAETSQTPSQAAAAIQIGTDCSGIEAPIQALENLGVHFEHVFSSDKDRHARAMIRANFAGSRHQLYEDIMLRDHARAPACDVHVAGWPCQGNSRAGKRKGFEDARSHVFHSVVEYIRYHRPRLVVMENVDNLLKVNDGKDFQTVVAALEDVDAYNIRWEVLNTRDHGVPQNRRRVYFVFIRKDVDQGTFAWPLPLGATPGIDRFLDTRGAEPALTNDFAPTQNHARDTFKAKMEELIGRGATPLSQPFLFDVFASKKFSSPMRDTCPCLTRLRSMWTSHHGRALNLTEKCRLMGMHPRRMKVVVSENQFAKQLGNSMSVNVLERILARALPAAGLTAPLRDRWASEDAVAALEATRDC